MTITREDIERLRALEKAAEVGPWTFLDGVIYTVENEKWPMPKWMSEDDAALIVEARNALPALLARIEELEGALKDVVDGWDWWRVDTYDRCSTVPGDAIETARKILKVKP